MNYGEIRKAALSRWLEGTNRRRVGLTDRFNSSFECKWQKSVEPHISLFCSLGKFSTNLTDILTDERFDVLHYTDDNQCNIIFRQYTKIALVTSEMLADLSATYKEAVGEKDGSKIRTKLSKGDTSVSVNRVLRYINHVFKHKYNRLHKCNHHVGLCFEDINRKSCTGNVLDISNASDDKCKEPIDLIVVPKIEDIINCIINCYEELDLLFDKDPKAFNKICTKFSKETITV